MSRTFPFQIRSWAFWTPESEPLEGITLAEHRGPPLRFLEPLLRRKCRKLARASLDVAFRCVQGLDLKAVRTVFASRYGESETTLELLISLAQGKPLSPLQFSLSVHNTASGLFSIASGNHGSAQSIAAGPDTLSSAFIESLSTLHASGNRGPVLVVAGDEPVNGRYVAVLDEPPSFYALGMLLERPREEGDMEMTLIANDQGVNRPHDRPFALDFVRFLLSNQQEFLLPHRNLACRFVKKRCNLDAQIRGSN